MRAIVEAKAFRDVLKGMKPRSKRIKIMRDPVARVTAGGASLVLLGEFANSASVAAEIVEAGSGDIPIRTALDALAPYPNKAKIEVRSEIGAFWIDKAKLPVRAWLPE